jgi:hypothetical protein
MKNITTNTMKTKNMKRNTNWNMKKTLSKGRPLTLPIPEVVNYKHLQQNKGVRSWLGPYELQEHKEGHKLKHEWSSLTPILKGRKRR